MCTDNVQEHFNTVVLRLAERYAGVKGSNKIARRQEKFSKAESQILRCGEDIQSLEKFIELQRTGFRKILKKYKVRAIVSKIHPLVLLLTRTTEMDSIISLDGTFQRRNINV